MTGANTVVYWQKTGAAQENPTTYVVGNNQANAQKFDIVRRLDAARAVGLKGIVGVIFSDPAGRNRASRLYWHDKQTGLVSDVPSESAVNPVACWGYVEKRTLLSPT